MDECMICNIKARYPDSKNCYGLYVINVARMSYDADEYS